MKYFCNTSWLFAEKILRMLVGLLVGIWVARYLGPEQFGLFSYVQSFVGLFATIATLGLDGIVVREIVNDAVKAQVVLTTAFWLKLVAAFFVLLLLAIAVHLTSNDDSTNTLVFIIASATFFQAFNVVDFYFQAKVMSKYVVFANVLSLFFSSTIKIALILNEAPLVAFAWVVLFDSIILAIGYIYFYLQYSTFRQIKMTWDMPTAKNLLKDSWPLILSGIVISIYMKIDQVMIQEMLGSEAVGQYAAAVRISEAWYFIPVVVTSSLFPAIVNAKKMSEELYYERLQKLYNFMVLIAVVIALPMTFLSDWVINLLYGSQYLQAGSVLMIHIWSGVFVFLGVASAQWLISENFVYIAFFRNLVGSIGNVLLNILLIPKLGIQGAAIATLIAWMLSSFLFDFILPKTRTMFRMKMQALTFNILKDRRG